MFEPRMCRNSLAINIKQETNALRLAKILEENKICTIGVHPFFLSNVRRRYTPGERGKQKYDKYVESVAGLYAYGKDIVFEFIFESYVHSIATARKEMGKHGVLFESRSENIFYSPDGAILEYSMMDGVSRKMNSPNLQNAIGDNYKRMIELILGAKGIFVFGMYKCDCVANTVEDLKKIKDIFGLKHEIYTNSKLVKDYSDFY